MKLFAVFALIAVAAARPQDLDDVQILSQSFEQDDQGNYQWAYELDNGSRADQSGTSIPGAEPETGSIEVQGSFNFEADGTTYSVQYTAGEQGYVAVADHLPKVVEQIAEYAQLRVDHPELFWAEQQ